LIPRERERKRVVEIEQERERLRESERATEKESETLIDAECEIEKIVDAESETLERCRSEDVRLPGKGNSTAYGARPVHLIITMIKWIRTSRLSM